MHGPSSPISFLVRHNLHVTSSGELEEDSPCSLDCGQTLNLVEVDAVNGWTVFAVAQRETRRFCPSSGTLPGGVRFQVIRPLFAGHVAGLPNGRFPFVNPPCVHSNSLVSKVSLACSLP